ncbi:HNH endonuclease signature motif containing protein [Caldifermentibacillus hisashii]|uniref:HNH endonuclease n=2 Tax=Caldibacillus thermoamylovorans TaxID=35841 RepID=A0ABD4AAH7_9BACI|nr:MULTISPECIES: HNH endonuclease signature motif containing protein [Bacillaceae]KIO66204.1 hypothetical protein B4166_2609 [Caldibacillus thermoamylovorans]KIO73677.1 hypothetical protein B4167_1920 [Caldibacillus thermoamylovorans]MEC5271153.1 HNH endonuclease signature motif containing protein [Caldifermentibacillus hisashii]
MKKLLIIFLSFLIFSSSFSGVNVKAQTNNSGENSFQVLTFQDVVTKFSDKIYLKAEDDGKTQRVTRREFDNLKELVREKFKNSSEEKTLFNKEPVNPNGFLESNSQKYSQVKADVGVKNTGANYLEVARDIVLNPSNRTITLSLTISDMIGEPPVIVVAGSNLYNSKEPYGAFYQVFDTYVEWTGLEIFVGQTYSKSYTVSETNYWMVSTTAVSGWLGSVPKSHTLRDGPFLTNSIAAPYPIILNKHNGKYMPHPARADYAWLPPEDRVPRDAEPYRANYIKQYIDTYGDPKWDWSLLDIHHVRPLEYGGNHDFNNLFALPREMHQREVTPWWTNY